MIKELEKQKDHQSGAGIKSLSRRTSHTTLASFGFANARLNNLASQSVSQAAKAALMLLEQQQHIAITRN